VCLAQPVVLEGVPAYDWYHGCGPTATASVVGYWDLHGLDGLFDAAGPDVYLTANVQDQISSPAHNAKYDPTPDDPDLPVPPATSIADFMGTSADPLDFGGSYEGKGFDGAVGYGAYRGYAFDAYTMFYASFGFTWNALCREINAGRPLLLMVDSKGGGAVDHMVPVFGYDDRGPGRPASASTSRPESSASAHRPVARA
jgi:hypothetical protein